jgi:hypothetical protein
MQLEPSLQKYYEERFSMMSTQGWKELMEDVDKMIERKKSTIQKRRVFNTNLAEKLETSQRKSI